MQDETRDLTKTFDQQGVRSVIRFTSASIFFLTILACTRSEMNGRNSDDIQELKNKINYLEDELGEIHANLLKNDHSTAYFSPESQDFLRLDSSLSSFFVSIKDVKPYADGFKLTLNLGNPNFASFQDVTLNITWGPRVTKDVTFLEAEKRKQTRVVKIGRTVLPASWNRTEVTIGPATKEDIGSISISIDTPIVALKAR